MQAFIHNWLTNRLFLWALFVVNLLGTVYGYIWYIPQLEVTDPVFLIFVPDSPTASLFFTLVIFAYLIGKQWPLMEALALVTLVKYGLWATVMNLLTLIVAGDLHWTGYMLMASHMAMALQGVLYASYYRFKWWHLVAVAIWTLHNDVIDYVYMQFPRYSRLIDYIDHIGYFTFWLSIACLALAYVLVLRKGRTVRRMPGVHSS